MIQELNCQQLAEKLTNNEDIILLDVREEHEVEIASIAGSMHIPMNLIPLYLDRIPDGKTIVIYCHHGVRSLNVAQYLVSVGFDESDLYNLKGGIDSWALTIDKAMPRY